MYGTTHELVIYWRSKPQPRFYVISGPQALILSKRVDFIKKISFHC